MLKKRYEFVFVILVYRNSEDLISCLDSISRNVNNYRVVIVNSYYDDESKASIEIIAKNNNCDFINVENKGYGTGNNRGIEFASETYFFDYLVVSNPDITIEKFVDHIRDLEGMDIIAPQIIARNGKNQNPILVYDNKIADFCLYVGYKKKWNMLVLLGFALNKIPRELFIKLYGNKVRRVYGAHGSFVVYSQKVINKLTSNPYDEKIFLFSEEFVIASKAKKAGLNTFYYPEMCIRHMEDGSIVLANISENEHLSKSSIYYYENYRKR